MEVLHRPGLMHSPQFPGMYQPAMSRLYTSRADMYTCYSLQVTTPSRTPTPEHYNIAYHNHYSTLSTSNHTQTLQSVLRDVPPAYNHFTGSTSLAPSNQLSSKSFYTSSLLCNKQSKDIEPISLSPCSSLDSSSNYSPRPSSQESETSQDSNADLQTEPMDLSCKKTFRKRKASSAFLDVAFTNNHTTSSPHPVKLKPSRPSSSEFISQTATTTSSSSSSSPMHIYSPSSAEGQNEEFSLLRNLLSIGKDHNGSANPGKVHLSPPSLTSDTNCDSLNTESFQRNHLTGNTQVQLAKKNLFPVSARISDWLVKIVQFSRSIPEFSTLSHNDKITLILNSWSRIMLLYMAESNFQFAVTPIPSSESTTNGHAHSQEEPTMKAVEGMQTFIKKCQQMAVDGKEYDFVRMLVLFNSGYPGLSCPETIDQLSSVVQQLLQQHVKVSRPRELMHYSRLLMCLPYLYSINGNMFENLFCTHITKSTDMEVLLKELIQSIP